MSRTSDKRKIPDNKYYGLKPRQSNKERIKRMVDVKRIDGNRIDGKRIE